MHGVGRGRRAGTFYCYSKLYRMSTIPRGCMGVSCGQARQHLLSTKGRGGPRRTATATPFVREGPRRAAEYGNGNTFCPRRAAEGRGERQRQHLLSAKGHEGARRTATATPFVHEGPRRAAKNGNGNTFCPRRAAKNTYIGPHGPRKHLFGPHRAAKNTFWAVKDTLFDRRGTFLVAFLG